MVILAYHHITQPEIAQVHGNLAVSTRQFESQMRYLRDRGYCCLSLIELLRLRENHACQKDRVFAVTFDDGYEDFMLALPILRRYGFTATIFLVSEKVGGESDWQGDRGAHLLTWEQVRALSKEGITFGSHTCTHPCLPLLSNEQIRHELAASKQRLESELGHEIQVLCYPYGESNDEIQSLAAVIGYQAACGSSTGRPGSFNLWRLSCHQDESQLSFAFKLSRWYGGSMALRRWLREETASGRFLRKLKRQWLGDRRGLATPSSS